MAETEKENEYLQFVYGELLQAEEAFTQILQNARAEGVSTLKTMTSDIRLNFSNISDNLDTFAMLEMKNREIDQMNIKVQTAEVALEKVKRLLESPFFGKINVDFLDGESQESFYIGVTSFTADQGENLVYDWRSPIAELFYNNELGPSFYMVNQNQIDVDITGRRQFVIKKNRLIQSFDTSIAIQDDVLLAALEQDSTSQMMDITSTIQKEQNVIIRDMLHPILLVNGVAGSGKTSTIMQRIAYLLYSLRQEITSDNILILSPNNKFVSYISDVLPSLGERNPLNMTLLQFVGRYLSYPLEDEASYFTRISQEEVTKQTQVLRSKAFVEYIKKAEISVDALPNFFKEVKKKDKVIISKAKINEMYQGTPVDASVLDRIQATKKRLAGYWENRLSKQAKKRETQDQILSLPEELQQKYFGELIEDESEASISEYAKQLLHRNYRKVTKAIAKNDWLDIRILFEQLYFDFTQAKYIFDDEDHFNLDEAAILFLIEHLFVERIVVPKMRFILIDEVQDYTPAQIRLLAELFPKTEFTMVGDENQAIFNSHISFAEIESNLEDRTTQIKKYDLLNSYRSSGAITKVFRELATTSKKMEIIPIRPDGNQPQFFEINTITAFNQRLIEISKNLNGEKLTIITKTETESEQLRKVLIWKQGLEPAIDIIPVSLSKGLEFDHVLIYNASQENYRSERDQKILYTAISRGMKNLFVVYENDLSSFLIR